MTDDPSLASFEQTASRRSSLARPASLSSFRRQARQGQSPEVMRWGSTSAGDAGSLPRMTTTPAATTSPKPRTSRPFGAWLALAAILATHATLAVRLFPSLGSIFEPSTPVVVVDHAIHEYHGSLGAQFAREAGTTWGYDPAFMAGYPETPVWDSSSNPSILFDLLGGARAGDYRAYKAGLFGASLLGLVAIAAGGWAAGLRAGEVAAGAGLAGLYFWAGFPIALWRSGLFAFLSASSGTALLLGLCVRFDRRPSRACWLALAASGSALFFVHVTAPILAGGGALAFYLTVARRHGRRWHAAVIGAAGVTAAINLVWLVPLWRFREIRVGSGYFMTTDSARFLLDYYLGPSADSRIGLVLLGAGSAGLAGWWFGGRRPAAAAFGGSIVALVLLTGFGSLWGPTKTLEPLRFRVSFCLLLALPAGSAAVMATSALARRRRGMIAAALAWAAILGTWGTFDRPFFRATFATLSVHRPLIVGVPSEGRTLTRWLRTNTDLSARILFEDQLRLMEATDPESVHWTPLLPALLGGDARMFIGGLYQTAFIKHHQMAAFGDFTLGDRPIDAWTSAEVAAYLDRYNIGWVACWSPLSRFCFDRHPGAKRVATLPRYATPGRPVSTNEHEWTAMIRRAGVEVARKYMFEGEGTYSLYRLDRPHTYFLRGSGRVVAVAPNRVELADVVPEDGVAVLSLHWLDTWQSDPPVSLKPQPVPPDPVDFVRIESKGPIPRLILSNGYRRAGN